MLRDDDTIAAIATPPGHGGIGIVRVSGPLAQSIARAVTRRKVLCPRHAYYGPFYGEDGEVLDQGIALFFPGPHSFTGEDVLELQGHGGPVVLEWLLRRTQDLGARLAEPGEFSRRAFLNDKLDLTQAEAVADLINATTEQAAKSALKSLQGAFARQVDELVQGLIDLRLYVEASIDFPEEEIDFLADGQVADRLRQLIARLKKLLAQAQQGALLQEGMTVVILGRPNAGKSSLLNALAGRESAIVTPVAGTTRDTIRERIQIEGLPLHIVDTAGLRETEDVVERIGIERAWQAIEQADHALVIIPADGEIALEDAAILEKLPETIPVTVVRNKIDLIDTAPHIEEEDGRTVVWLSAKHGQGLDLLRTHLKKAVGYAQTPEGVFMARRRHVKALEAALEQLQAGAENLEIHAAGELLAEDLRQAQQALETITGRFTSDDLLGEIFSSFCIGK